MLVYALTAGGKVGDSDRHEKQQWFAVAEKLERERETDEGKVCSSRQHSNGAKNGKRCRLKAKKRGECVPDMDMKTIRALRMNA